MNPERLLIRTGLVDAKNDASYGWIQVKLVVLDHMVVVTTPGDKLLPWSNMPVPMNLLDVMEEEDKAEVEPKANRFQSFRSSLKKEKSAEDQVADGETQTSTSLIKSGLGSIRKKKTVDDLESPRPRRGSMDSTHGHCEPWLSLELVLTRTHRAYTLTINSEIKDLCDPVTRKGLLSFQGLQHYGKGGLDEMYSGNSGALHGEADRF